MPLPSPCRVAVVADDLTSATDGAAPFLAKGYVPQIVRGAPGVLSSPVVAIDTDSRAATEAEAAARTAAAVGALRDRAVLFKTIDSTLRGHARSEIAAAFRASGRRRLVLAPAFPEAGRLTRDGLQFVRGTLVSESVYARDPTHPARTSRIADLIDPSLGQAVVVPMNARPGDFAPAQILILDADSQAALNAQVARLPDPETILWVGSPGLAIALAALVPESPGRSPVATPPSTRILIVAGSANPATHAQCTVLAENGIPVVRGLAAVPAGAPVVCLRAPDQRQKDPGTVLADLVDPAAAALAQGHYDALIATGGETMAAMLDRLSISHLMLTGEIEPGFPVGIAERTDGRPLAVAMKAGGFGSPATLLRAVQYLAATRATR